MEFNTLKQNRIPINRNNLFYSDESFDYEKELGKMYVEMDMNQSVILYRVDLSKTNSDTLYGETAPNSVIYQPPVEIQCMYELEDSELKSYDKSKNLGTYTKLGKLRVGIYKETLSELNVEIKKGDYIGVMVNPEHMEFFVVNYVNPNYHNEATLFGVYSPWVMVHCSSVDPSEFQA